MAVGETDAAPEPTASPDASKSSKRSPTPPANATSAVAAGPIDLALPDPVIAPRVAVPPVSNPTTNGRAAVPPMSTPSKRDQRRIASAAAAASRPPLRRVRHKLRRIDLWSVLKISLCFFTAAIAILLLAGVVLWFVADSTGLLKHVEKLAADNFSAPDFRIVGSRVFEGAALIGLVLDAVLVVVTVVGAALYNVFSDLFGGVEFSTIEEELPARRRTA
jgi:hypothetical protein